MVAAAAKPAVLRGPQCVKITVYRLCATCEI